MKLVIMRHGQAEAVRKKDEARALSTLGKRQATDAGKWLAEYLGENRLVDLAMVSPYTRAQQTYNELSLVVNVASRMNCDDITPDGNPEFFHDYLHTLVSQNPSFQTILVVSHMPFVCYFLEEVHKSKESMLFDTSSIVIIDYNPEVRSGEVEKSFHPKFKN